MGDVVRWMNGITARGYRDHWRPLIEVLHEILREEDVERPIDRDAHFLFRARQFAPVDAAPEKPRNKSGKVYSENARHAGATADRRQQSERFEAEWLLRLAVNARDDVVCENFSFARRVLRCRRTIPAGRRIGH